MELKKMIPAVFLAALLIWGIYDMTHKSNISNTNSGNSNVNVSRNTQDNKSTVQKTGIEKGDLAPDFQLQTLDGKEVKLSDYRGKKVVLNFWATWCPPCKAEIPDLEKFYSSNKDKNMVILGVDLTQAEKVQSAVKDFVKSEGITYPVALDTDGTASTMYQVSAIPTSYIIDTKGVITEKVVGPMDYETMNNLLSGIN